MESLKEKRIEKTELLNVIRDSLEDAREVVQKLDEVFRDSVQSLRIEESAEVFDNITLHIHELQKFVEFMRELKSGADCFDNFGLPADPLSSGDAVVDLFNEISSAFMSNDWIMLSDLIEYELSPMLVQEDEWLGALKEKVAQYVS